jgi:RNA polymerase sigma factor (sigma-70 family)
MADDTLSTDRFEALIAPHFDALYRAAMRLTRSREDAEDLVQEVTARALPELERLAALDSPRSWMLRVQYRIFVDQTRRRQRSPVLSDGACLDPGLVASEAPGPEELAEEHQRRRQLARVWDRLDRKERALLGLHAEGYSLAELAEITGASSNAVGVRLHRARARLARLIRNESTGALTLAGVEA